MMLRPYIIFALAGIPCLLFGMVRHVPADYSTIGAALEATAANDTVLIAPGRYDECLQFPSHDLVLASHYLVTGDTGSIRETVIDATICESQDTSGVLTFTNGSTQATKVSGLTLTGGHGCRIASNSSNRWGGCIYASESHPTIEWCRIVENQSARECAAYFYHSLATLSHCEISNNCGENGVVRYGHGILFGYALFEWNEVHHNYFCGSGGPVMIDNGVTVRSSSLIFRYNYFHHNEGNNAGLDLSRSHAEIHGNRFEHIAVLPFGHIIRTDYYSNPVTDNVFRDCQLEHGACIQLEHPNPNLFLSIVEGNWFENIQGDRYTSGIYLQFPNAEIRNNVFMLCAAQGSALGLSHFDPRGCRTVVERNYFFGNRHLGELQGGTALHSQGLSPICEVRDNWFSDNSGVSVEYQLESSDTSVYDATLNYWGDPSGPYHPTENPTGQGDTVDVNIHVTPWLTEPPDLGVDVGERLKLNPEDWTLEQIFPNPFNGQTNIRIIASKPQPMSVVVYNTLGQKIANVWQGVIAKDEPTLIRWDGVDNFGRGVASGVYYVVAEPRGSLRGAPKAQKAVLLR